MAQTLHLCSAGSQAARQQRRMKKPTMAWQIGWQYELGRWQQRRQVVEPLTDLQPAQARRLRVRAGTHQVDLTASFERIRFVVAALV